MLDYILSQSACILLKVFVTCCFSASSSVRSLCLHRANIIYSMHVIDSFSFMASCCIHSHPRTEEINMRTKAGLDRSSPKHPGS